MIPALRMHVPALIAAVDESHAFGSVQAAANPVTHEYAMDMCQLLRLVHRFHEHGWYHGAIRPAALFAGNVRSRSASSSASMPAASDFGTETDSEAAASAVAAEAATSKDVRFGAEIEDDETTEAVTESESEAEWASMPGQLRSQVQDPITDYTSVLGLWNRARYVPAHDVRKAKGKSQHQAEHQTVHPDEGKGKQKATGPTFDYDPERPWISFDGMADSRDVDDLMWRYLPADLWYGSREISLKRLDAYGLGQLFFERINERPMYDFEPHFLKLIETIVKTAPSRQETKRTTFDEAVPWYEKLGELKPGREGLAERLSRVTGVVDSQHKYYIRLPIQTEPGDPISHVEAIIRHQTPRTNKGGFAIITYSHLFKAADTGADFLQACSRKVAKGVNKFLSRSPRKTADGRESESEEEPSQSQQATRALSVAAGHKRMVMAWLANKPSSTVPWMTKMEFKMIRSLLDINSDRSLAEEADHFQCPPLHPSLAHDPPSFR
ncbi:hypothetical protein CAUPRSCDRAFT_12032 [Caulochytrium protostelioides]|nr:hypothetical protein CAUPRSCDRAFT_12032 [Caulochytrium protostelioides]